VLVCSGLQVVWCSDLPDYSGLEVKLSDDFAQRLILRGLSLVLLRIRKGLSARNTVKRSAVHELAQTGLASVQSAQQPTYILQP
jgi:hypothetical protein